MTETTSKKQVNTLIDRDLHKEAVLKDVSWARALELGVRIMVGDHHEKALRKERNELRGRISYIDTRLEEITHIKDSKGDINAIFSSGMRISQGEGRKVTVLQFLKQSFEAIKANRGLLGARTKAWNNVTGMNLNDNEFLVICERAEAGEFKGAKG